MFRKQKINVGVIGLGIIGSQVAAHLRTAGYNVLVWNRTPKTEPNFLGSPAQVAEVARVIQLFVADGNAVLEVIDAMEGVLTPEHTIICNATIGYEDTLEAARRVQARGAKFLDAPFTGSKGAAEKAHLLYYIGGADDVFQAVKPILEVTGGNGILKIGEIGQAAVIKVVTNVISAATIETLAEMLAVVKSAGIAPEVLSEALEKHGIRSAVLTMKLPMMIEGDYDPHFSLKNMLKDVRLALDLGTELKLDLPVTQTTATVMTEDLNRGWADLDFSSVMMRYS